MKLNYATAAMSATIVVLLAPGLVAQTPECDFSLAFRRADEKKPNNINVYRDNKSIAPFGQALAFVDELKVNTDGTRRSYHLTDTRGESKAINSVANAISTNKVKDFEALRDAGFPAPKSRQQLGDVIEFAKQPSKPCIGPGDFLVSMTSVGAVPGVFNKQGDCDQSKWLDALTVPALVLPKPSCKGCKTEFDNAGATNRNFVVAMTVAPPHTIAYGIVGDKGPVDQLGEASVGMNARLNNLPANAEPTNYKDAIARFQAPKSIVLIIPGEKGRVSFPKDAKINAAHVEAEAKPLFEAWGGAARLRACAAKLETGRAKK
jgi:hypothetical protein